MKKLHLFSVQVVCTMILASSCSTNNDISTINDSEEPTKEYDTEEYLEEMHKRYECINVEDYIEHFPEIFGKNVLVFDNYDDAETLLTKFSECRHEELRELSNSLGICNEIINSNIAYDSTLDQIAKEYFGIDYYSDQFNELDDNILNEFYSIATEKLRYEHPNWASYDDDYGYCVNPVGNIDDLAALCNDKQIVIIDKVVHRISSTLILTCPIDKYIQFPQFENDSLLWEAYLHDHIDGISAEKDASIARVPTVPEQETITEDVKAHVVKKGNYKLSIYITAFPEWSWGKTNIHGTISVTNYYSGKKHKANVYGIISFNADVVYKNQHKFAIIWHDGTTFNGTYKYKKYNSINYGNNYTPTLKTHVSLRDVVIDMTQKNSGIQIKYMY